MGWLRDAFRAAKQWVEDRIEDIKNYFGGSSSYSGSSVAERVDVEKEISKFKDDFSEKAASLEDERLQDVMGAFDQFVESLWDSYPSLIDEIKKRQGELSGTLKGTITQYLEKHMSENNAGFREVLAMEPGSEKREKVGEKMDEILSKADRSFDRKLKKAMKKLHSELGERLRGELSEKERELEEETSAYEGLVREAETGAIDLERLEAVRVPVADAAACIGYFFAEDE